MVEQHQLPVLLPDHLPRCTVAINTHRSAHAPRPSRFRPVALTALLSVVGGLRCLQYERRFSLIHRLLESALVERFAKSVGAGARAAEGYEAGSTLWKQRQ